MDEVEKYRQKLIKSLEDFKDWSHFPHKEFEDLIRKAMTLNELSDLGQCLDTWKYGY